MKKLRVHFPKTPEDERAVGSLAEDRGRIYFEYDEDFLKTGWDLSPFRLPFAAGLFEHRDREFGPLPGLFDDSLPDGWGLLLMDRHLRKLGMRPEAMSSLDRLAYLGTRCMGALSYHPSKEWESEPHGLIDLHDLARDAEKVLSGQAGEILPELFRAGGSPGGARPKVIVNYHPLRGELRSGAEEPAPGFEPWLVKFASRQDGKQSGVLEYAYALMAKSAGIDLPASRLFATDEGDAFFGMKRFDREGPRRIHMHSFGNLIQANFRIPANDYEDLLKATSLLCRKQPEVIEAFRRMVFNIRAHNRDDHVKNFSFLLDDETGEWRLSPAYDLTFSSGPGGEHSLTVAGEGRAPGMPQIFQIADKAGISDSRSRQIISEVSQAISCWHEFAAQAGLDEARTREVQQTLSALS